MDNPGVRAGNGGNTPAVERRRREREVFLGALAVAEGGERTRYLEEACGGDVPLRDAVHALLAEATRIEGFLDESALKPRGRRKLGGAEWSGLERPGQKIGRYRLLEELGEGGCGVVFLAEQEEPIRRVVALKVIKWGMDTRSVMARFEAERQAIALMDHGNIARVLDAGSTDTGRPYFVMEVVRGIRITEFCDDGQLPLTQRLELFIPVCAAVQHAHQKGIVHRDLKPSNILVTLQEGKPVPKVIDFGIAKAMEDRPGDRTSRTSLPAFLGTPAYMSPEQAAGGGVDVDTRSDLYSLGVLLYELLTGRTPLDAETSLAAGLDEYRRRVLHDDPLRPSQQVLRLAPDERATVARQRGTGGAQLAKELRGDLDAIVLKCLEKDRARRYGTAQELIADLERFLRHEPVSARVPGPVDRTRKLLRRHRAVALAGAAVVLTLVVGAGLSVGQAVRARAAEREEFRMRQEAERERTRARASEAQARLNEYVADINLAHQSLLSGNFGRATELLAKHQAAPGSPELRGFEWRHLWKLSRGDERRPLHGQGEAILGAAYAPDGRVVAVALRDRVHILDGVTGALVVELPGAGAAMAFASDRPVLVTGGRRGVQLWSTGDWSLQRLIAEATDPVVVAASGKLLAHGSREGAVVRSMDSGEPVAVLPDVRGAMAFSPDGTRLVGRTDEGLAVWSVPGGQRLALLEESRDLTFGPMGMFRPGQSVAFAMEGREIVAVRNHASARGIYVLSVWDAETGKELRTLPADPARREHTGVIAGLAVSADGRRLATAAWDHSIRLWDVATGRVIRTLHGHPTEVWAVDLSPDGSTVLTGGKDGGVNLWSTDRPRNEGRLTTDWMLPLTFSADGRRLLAVDPRGNILALDPETGRPDETLNPEGETARVRWSGPWPRVAVTQEGRWLARALRDGRVEFVDRVSDAVVQLGSDLHPFDGVVLSPDGQVLLGTTRAGQAWWWEPRAGTNLLLTLRGRELRFSASGRRLVALENGVVDWWDVGTRQRLATSMIDPEAGSLVAVSPDGAVFATASRPDSVENLIQLWDSASGRLLKRLAGHKQGVMSVAFAPDGLTLASSSTDSTVRLWNVATGQELMSLQRLGEIWSGLQFSPDGRCLVGAVGMSSGRPGIYALRAPTLGETDSGVVTWTQP